MYRTIFLCLLAAGMSSAGNLKFRQSGFADNPSGWTAWSARPETSTRTYIDPVISLGEPGSLAVSGNGNVGSFGGWQRLLDGVRSGGWYRLTVHYRAVGVESENWQVLPRLDWHKSGGGRAGEVDYAYNSTRHGEWTRVTLETQAPAGAAAVALQLFLAHAPLGTVWWDDISLEEIPPPLPRLVTIAAVNLKPERTGSAQESVRQFLETIERAVPPQADLILLPEGITVVGTGKSYADVSEPVPGPTTRRLGEVARNRKAYIAAGIYEREGQVVYNTAVLLDRHGDLVGKYRKVHLPREEMERLTPGNEYLVFETDFGRLGMMICYDVFFSDPAQGLASRGAEVVLMPIWGGDETLAKARAVENRFFLVASGYDHPTYIMDPNGERVAQAFQRGTVAVATIDLSKRYVNPNSNLGNMRDRRPKETRLDVKTGIPGLGAPEKQ